MDSVTIDINLQNILIFSEQLIYWLKQEKNILQQNNITALDNIIHNKLTILRKIEELEPVMTELMSNKSIMQANYNWHKISKNLIEIDKLNKICGVIINKSSQQQQQLLKIIFPERNNYQTYNNQGHATY